MKTQGRVPGAGPRRAGLTRRRAQFYSAVELVERDGSVGSLLKVFNDQSASDRAVQFLRLLTSASIRNRADFFRHFLDEETDIKDFCTHVGPQGPSAQPRAPLSRSLGDTWAPVSLARALAVAPTHLPRSCLNRVALGTSLPVSEKGGLGAGQLTNLWGCDPRVTFAPRRVL